MAAICGAKSRSNLECALREGRRAGGWKENRKCSYCKLNCRLSRLLAARFGAREKPSSQSARLLAPSDKIPSFTTASATEVDFSSLLFWRQLLNGGRHAVRSERERSLIFPNGLAIMQIRLPDCPTPRMAHSSSRDPLFHACHDLQCLTVRARGRRKRRDYHETSSRAISLYL